jgi:peptide/nickel transport system substrate-binding protein
MNRLIRAGVPVVAATLLLSACSGKSADSKGQVGAKSNIAADQIATADAKGNLDSLTWSGDYRPPYSLDSLKTADYPEETILNNVCEPLLRVKPDYSLAPGIASSWKQTDGTHLVFQIDPRAHFSNGKPVTPADVAYSIKRNLDPNEASNYADAFSPVSDVSPTGPAEVTVTLSKPNYVLVRDLGTAAGAVVEKANTEAQGQNFGAVGAPVVCAGPYTIDSFDGTNSLVLKKDPNYWDPSHAAKAAKVTFQFFGDPKAFTTALDQGTLQGAFNVPPASISTLHSSAGGTLFVGGEGSSTQNIDLIVSKLTGNLGDAKVRQALSLAIDRAGIAKTLYAGAADPLYTVVGPGFFRYLPDAAKNQYQAAYDKLKITPDLKKAADLVTQAGAKGKTITLAYVADGSTFAQLAQVLQQTGSAIGLDLKIVGLPAQQYGSLFTDEKARADYDGFLTVNYLEFPEPAAMYASYTSKEGIQNFNGYTDAAVEDALTKAQATEDPAARAQLVLQAQDKISQDLPWIPIVAPRLTLFQNKGVTGAPLTFSYLSSAWAAAVGTP